MVFAEIINIPSSFNLIMVRTVNAIEIRPAKYKALRIQLIIDLDDPQTITPKQMEDEATDLAEIISKAASPMFAQFFIEKFRSKQNKLST
jgi:hypothetical protein